MNSLIEFVAIIMLLLVFDSSLRAVNYLNGRYHKDVLWGQMTHEDAQVFHGVTAKFLIIVFLIIVIVVL